ncbi:MAG: hypothetical protein IJ479_07900 [Alphaproteobacteria bacterium]|nr:hypothetical protein [Alphaproteobacteria bacterium]
MYNFEELREMYENISQVEKALADFREYAVYELDGGLSVWIETKEVILGNLQRQKLLLRNIREKGSGFTAEQILQMREWQLD